MAGKSPRCKMVVKISVRIKRKEKKNGEHLPVHYKHDDTDEAFWGKINADEMVRIIDSNKNTNNNCVINNNGQD